jgi:DNA-directed RNA polymerase subunit RPC12/RpoP
MFCYNCGTKLPDNAKFCFNCGTKLEVIQESNVIPTVKSTQFVPARCTNCGGELTVDSSLQSAICPYCNTPFIVDQAINNYNISSMQGNMNIGNATINVNGLNTENLLARAQDFENHNDFDNALIYYNRVLDIDINNVKAKNGIESTKQKMEDYVYINAISPNLFSADDKVEVRRDRITIITSKGKVEEYYIDKIKNEKLPNSYSIQFDYAGTWLTVIKGFADKTEEIYNFIVNAKMGIYPSYK